jgi:hypothetical protein
MHLWTYFDYLLDCLYMLPSSILLPNNALWNASENLCFGSYLQKSEKHILLIDQKKNQKDNLSIL